jgi:hypothetical protein
MKVKEVQGMLSTLWSLSAGTGTPGRTVVSAHVSDDGRVIENQYGSGLSTCWITN